MLVLVKMASKSVTRSIGLLYTHVGLSIALILWISGKGILVLNTNLQRLPFCFFFFFFFFCVLLLLQLFVTLKIFHGLLARSVS